MFCRKCGSELRDGAKFCVKCGASVNGEMPVRTNQPVPVPVQEPKEKKKTKEKGPKMILIVLIIVILLVIGCLIGFILWDKTQSDSDGGLNHRGEESIQSDATETEETEEIKTEETEAAEDTEDAGAQMEALEMPTAIVGDDSVDPYGVHTYQIVMADVTWTEAYEAGRNVPNGYLVHINSEEEMAAILDQIEAEGYSNGIFWIGAMRATDSEDYHWVDTEGNLVGDSLNGNAFWLPGEPTWMDEENGVPEDVVSMFYTSRTESWVWNDTVNNLLEILPSYSGKMGYIIEIEN